jgi:hypothetical protein
MLHIALDRVWRDDGNLDHQIIKAPGCQAREHCHLRAALELEHAPD